MKKVELDIENVLSEIEKYIRDPVDVIKKPSTSICTLEVINSVLLHDAAIFLETLDAWCIHYSALDEAFKGLYVLAADAVPHVQFNIGLMLSEILEAQKTKS